MPELRNPLAVICGLMILVSTFYPWWTATIIGFQRGLKYVVKAYPYVLSVPENFPGVWKMGIIETPYVAELGLKGFLIACIASCFLCSVLGGGRGKRLLLATGILFLLYTAGFFGSLYYACDMRIASITGRPVPVQGSTFIPLVGDITTKFQPAFYLAIAAGLLCVVSTLFYGKLTLKF